MARFICKNCNYKFEGKEGKTPAKCPYCDRKSIAREQSASEILDESKE
jgi:predicted Zn-ribbon and HTH transcriptional regulator